MATRCLIFVLLAGFGHAAVRRSAPIPGELIQLDNGLNRGDWGPPDLCDEGSWTSSFEIKYADLGHVDDTALNAITLYCQDVSGALTNSVSSTIGQWGNWRGIRTCNFGEFLTGIRANVVHEQGPVGDDLGIDNIEMQCTDGLILNGLYGDESQDVSSEHQSVDKQPMEAIKVHLSHGKVGDHGDWGSWVSCSSGLRVCGIETRVEHESVVTDDAGATDIILYCCNV